MYSIKNSLSNTIATLAHSLLIAFSFCSLMIFEAMTLIIDCTDPFISCISIWISDDRDGFVWLTLGVLDAENIPYSFPTSLFQTGASGGYGLVLNPDPDCGFEQNVDPDKWPLPTLSLPISKPLDSSVELKLRSVINCTFPCIHSILDKKFVNWKITSSLSF